MNTIQSKLFLAAALLQSCMKSAIHVAMVVILLSMMSSCSDNDNVNNQTPTLTAIITEYNVYGEAMLDVKEEDMTKAGFTLGDVISITVEGREIIMPYYDGYYTRDAEYLCMAYPTYPSICFTINNVGLPAELTGLEGHSVVIKMHEKGGKKNVQQLLAIKYTNNRDDYTSFTDAEFANARAVSAGNIVEGVLHRASSPFCNRLNRAKYVSEYLEREQVKTVLNLADTEEDIMNYDLPDYSQVLWESGNVILCQLKFDPAADNYNERLIEALKELPQHPAPYVVHCLEGKDRTGYVCALLEGLCGATYEEMVADYLITYNNYYKKTPDKNPVLCDTLVSMYLHPCLMYYAGVSDEAQLPTIDYAKAFANYLLTHGMTQQQIEALVKTLTVK